MVLTRVRGGGPQRYNKINIAAARRVRVKFDCGEIERRNWKKKKSDEIGTDLKKSGAAGAVLIIATKSPYRRCNCLHRSRPASGPRERASAICSARSSPPGR